MLAPYRGFGEDEFAQRAQAAQKRMAQAGLGALLLTTEPEIRYYTGFLTRFWESPTRPWFVVLPASGNPIAVIPSIGAPLMGRTWITDIRAWAAPDYTDDGIGLLAETLNEIVPGDGAIGVADEMESHLRMPLADFTRLRELIGGRTIQSDTQITRDLRLIKSAAEIEKIRYAVDIADRSFARVGEIAAPGVPVSGVFRAFQTLCLEEGADWVPYLAGGAGPMGYADVISPATDNPLAQGDVLMLDTGLVWDGYFCDFDRNFAISEPNANTAAAHRRLIEATQAAFDAAKPGATMSDLFAAMDQIVKVGPNAGRLGHGLGMQLTEWPSIIPDDHTVLKPGMVLTIEPFVDVADGNILVHEENIVISESGAEFLSSPSKPEIEILC